MTSHLLALYYMYLKEEDWASLLGVHLFFNYSMWDSHKHYVHDFAKVHTNYVGKSSAANGSKEKKS